MRRRFVRSGLLLQPASTTATVRGDHLRTEISMTELSDDDIQKLFDKLVDAEVLPPDKMKELSGRFFAALEEKKREIAANPAVGEKSYVKWTLSLELSNHTVIVRLGKERIAVLASSVAVSHCKR